MPPPSIGFRVVVTDPIPIITRRLKQAIADHMNLAARRAAGRLRTVVGQIIQEAILQAPETQSLRGGILQADLGPVSVNVDLWIQYVIQRLISTIKVDVVPMGVRGASAKNGYLRVSVMPKTVIDEFINVPYGNYRTVKGQLIPWAEWLLTLGDKIIVRDYYVSYNSLIGSRTGEGTMRRAKGRAWRVPPQYSGTRQNNMITRALEDNADRISYALEVELVRHI